MKKLLTLIIAGLIFISGCRTITVEKEGYRVVYQNILMDTKLGNLTLTLPDGATLQFENLDTSSQALITASKALDLANTTIKKVP